MASFAEHLTQAKRNLNFLSRTNLNIQDSWDWQVTVCFYVAVHLVNAHIAVKSNEHYRSHEQVNDALNPYKILSPAKLTEDTYKAYMKLQGLSRRSRYLCNDNLKDKSSSAFFTYDKHLSKAIKNLDILIAFIEKEYREHFPKYSINCSYLKTITLNYFKEQNL